MYIFFALSTLFNAITVAIAGLLVFLKNKNNIINQTFAILCIFVVIWALGYFWPLTPDDKKLTLLSFQILHTSALFITAAHLHFICALLKIHKQKFKIIASGYIFNLIFLPFVPTKLFIADVVPKPPLALYPIAGPLYHIWLIFWLVLVIYSIYLLVCHYKNSIGLRHHQLKYLLILNIVTFSAGSTNFFLVYGIPFPPYLNIFTSIHILLLFYLIARYRFLDIRLNFVYILQKIFAFIFAISAGYFIYSFVFPFSGELQLVAILAVFLLTVLFLLFLRLLNFPFVYQILRITDFTQFKNHIDKFLNKDIFYHNLISFQQDLQETFCHKLKISAALILPLTKREQQKYPLLISYFEEKSSFLVTEELKMEQENENKEFKFLPELQSLGKVCFPLFNKNELIGFFVLGQKPFGNSYSKEELDILEHAAHYIALSLIIVLYNQELQREINKKTATLSQQNKKMRALLAQHANFLEVSAHELSTPLTIARLQADLIPESAQARTLRFSLERLYERVRMLIDSNTYSKKSIKLQLKQVKIKEYFQKIAANFKPLIEKEGRCFYFEDKIESELEVAIDEFQLWIVLQNLLINAKNFTAKNGLITLYLSTNKDKLKIGVIDNGEGIPDSEKENIFKKFKSNHATKGKGLGLGLYVARQIVRLYQGKIWCEDAPLKHGTAFYFTLPRNPKVK